MAAKKKEAVAIELPELDIQVVEITLIGDSPLVCHAWSDKAKRAMLDKQMKKATPAKEAKDPEADYLASLYPHPEGGYGFPAVAFRAAGAGLAPARLRYRTPDAHRIRVELLI